MSDQIHGRAIEFARLIFADKVEFIHNFKVAGLTLIDYLKCEYGNRTGRGRPRRGQPFKVSVMAVRDPIGRFASGISELLRRFLQNRCPGQPCWKIRGVDHGARSGVLRRQGNPWNSAGIAAKTQTRWYAAAQAMNATSEEQVKGLKRVVQGFVDDLSCARYFFDCEHIMSQSAFAATTARGLDILLDSKDLNVGLEKMHHKLRSRPRDEARCPLKWKNAHRRQWRGNGSSGSSGGLPDSDLIEAEIRGDPVLVRRLCTALMQDYICFGYALPEVCADLDPRRQPVMEL